MTSVETPQGFIVAAECEKAASQNGYRRCIGQKDGWAGFESTTAKGAIHLAAASSEGPWFLALSHAGIVENLKRRIADMPGPGLARYAFPTLGELSSVLPRIYDLGRTLPSGPLDDFLEAIQTLPRKTETERLVVQRVGQEIFRERLMIHWQGRCPLTGITDPELLRASHIIPWKECSNDAERLNIFNGLLLSALWDAAFDRGLVTFDNSGQPQFSPALTKTARAELRWNRPISLSEAHLERLAWQRANLFRGKDAN